jgi:hypothetical protein
MSPRGKRGKDDVSPRRCSVLAGQKKKKKERERERDRERERERERAGGRTRYASGLPLFSLYRIARRDAPATGPPSSCALSLPPLSLFSLFRRKMPNSERRWYE